MNVKQQVGARVYITEDIVLRSMFSMRFIDFLKDHCLTGLRLRKHS